MVLHEAYQYHYVLLTAGTLIILINFVQVTVLIFRDGAQLNLYHVLERPDGSYTPLSESLSGSSLRNLFASSGKREHNDLSSLKL